MVEQRKVGIYASCRFTDETKNKLDKWINELETEIPNVIHFDHLHSTIVYSRNDFEEPHQDLIESVLTEREFSCSEFRILKTREGAGALAIVLDANPLIDLHHKLKEYGADHNHDDYEPHVTLSYNVPDDFIVNLPVPDFKFEMDQILFEPLDINWKNNK